MIMQAALVDEKDKTVEAPSTVRLHQNTLTLKLLLTHDILCTIQGDQAKCAAMGKAV
jgi:hypothetical protein